MTGAALEAVMVKADIEIQLLFATGDVFGRRLHGEVAGLVVPDFAG